MTPQELKNSILQLAIQGKLVEQRPEEGTAEELYREIQKEKQTLIKAGKIKKEKPLPEISEDELPFEIPENWKWVRLGSIVTLNPKNELPDDLETAFIPMPCVADGYRNEHSYEIQKWGTIKKGFTHFAEGDIGIAKITPCFQNRKSVIFKNLPHGYGAGTTELSIVRVIECSLSKVFLLWFFKSEYFIANGKKSFTGTAGQQRIHKDYLATCMFPLPPLAEQKRIVAKIEELLPLIDRYEKAWTRLEDFNKRFPGDMQKSILQMAIQGKLVEQLPEEGTGEELYQQIQKEKQALIKAGKIKKEKPLPEITEEELPFDIPESWKWVRFGYVANIVGTGLVRPSTEQYTSAQYYYFKMNNIGNFDGLCHFESMNMINATDEEYEKYKLEEGDFLFNTRNSRELVGKVAVVPHLQQQVILNNNILKIKFFGNIEPTYISSFFNSPLGREQLFQFITNTTNVAAIYQKQLVTLIIPLPSLAEQKRIVARLEELLPLCEKLK